MSNSNFVLSLATYNCLDTSVTSPEDVNILKVRTKTYQQNSAVMESGQCTKQLFGLARYYKFAWAVRTAIA